MHAHLVRFGEAGEWEVWGARRLPGRRGPAASLTPPSTSRAKDASVRVTVSPEIQSGLIALLGVIVGGLFSYVSARVGQDWSALKSDVQKLAAQVAAYHRLEALYAEEVATLDADGSHTKTILTRMRDRAEESGATVRPEMTEKQAKKIAERWS